MSAGQNLETLSNALGRVNRKTFDAERILEAVDAGLRAFGENRVQEAEAKIPVVNERATPALEWHLVGSLQRNKARRAVELAGAEPMPRILLGSALVDELRLAEAPDPALVEEAIAADEIADEHAALTLAKRLAQEETESLRSD